MVGYVAPYNGWVYSSLQWLRPPLSDKLVGSNVHPLPWLGIERCPPSLRVCREGGRGRGEKGSAREGGRDSTRTKIIPDYVLLSAFVSAVLRFFLVN